MTAAAAARDHLAGSHSTRREAKSTFSPLSGATEAPLRVALVGNPNTGKSTLFNALTGLRQRVANFPGVTVERVEGSYTYRGKPIDVIDLPGAYSLTADSPDEAIATDVLLGRASGEGATRRDPSHHHATPPTDAIPEAIATSHRS